MILVKKIQSIKSRRIEKKYLLSDSWQNHPLNKKIPPTDFNNIDSEFEALTEKLDFECKEFVIDSKAYHDFKRRFRVSPWYALGYKDKKILEHYISYSLLNLQKGEIYIDVASENSPFPLMFRKKLLVKAYSQDLTYKQGMHGWEIGSSADNMPLADNSVDAISLQCAFEHFQGDIDINFMREIQRVLTKNGRCCIVPLYMSHVFQNIVDPLTDYNCINFDADATVIAEVALGGDFERVYNPESLKRILLTDLKLKYKIYKITGHQQIFGIENKMVQRVRYALLIKK